MKVTVKEAAHILERSEQFVRIGLQRNLLPFGFAMKRTGARKFDYFINPSQFAAYCGVTLSDLEGRLKA
jgi:hypothetical protein